MDYLLIKILAMKNNKVLLAEGGGRVVSLRRNEMTPTHTSSVFQWPAVRVEYLNETPLPHGRCSIALSVLGRSTL